MITYSICLSLCDLFHWVWYSRFTHVVANGRIPFLLWLKNFPLWVCEYAQTASSLAIHLLMDIHISSIILATVNNAAMNIGVYVSFPVRVSLSLAMSPGVELLELMGRATFTFVKNLHIFSTVVASVYISTINIQGFPFPHIPTNISYICSF